MILKAIFYRFFNLISLYIAAGVFTVADLLGYYE